VEQQVSDEKLLFFVYIIESPSAVDIYHGRSEGGLVARAIDLDGIPSVTRTVINPTAFAAAIRIGLPQVMKLYPNRLPIIHLSAHGAKHGIQLSDGQEIVWNQLRDLLVPINESLGGCLLLCMSACDGYSACQMAMEEGDGPHPFFSMVGNYGKPTWADTAVAYSAFYHHLCNGKHVWEAVEAMKAASGNDEWAHQTAEESKRGYLEYIQSVKPADAQEALEIVAQEQPAPEGAKVLEPRGLQPVAGGGER
jgi:hypothetical protein